MSCSVEGSFEADALCDDFEQHEGLPNLGDFVIGQSTRADQGVGHVVGSVGASWSCTENFDHADSIDDGAGEDHPVLVLQNAEGVPTRK